MRRVAFLALAFSRIPQELSNVLHHWSVRAILSVPNKTRIINPMRH